MQAIYPNFSSYYQDKNKLKNGHVLLNAVYYALRYSEEEIHFPDEHTLNNVNMLEEEWIRYDKNECLSKYNFSCIVSDFQVVERALKHHQAYRHHLFDYLSGSATEAELKQFILNESIMNIECMDYLMLAVIGASDRIKIEMMRKLSSGEYGQLFHFHPSLFKRLLKELGLIFDRDMIIAMMPWERLADINLFHYFSRYPYNRMKYFGLLIATDMLNTEHYFHLMKGVFRILKGKQQIDSCDLIDNQYAKNWLKHIVMPELFKHPEKTSDFWLGFYMGLDSVLRYYDRFLHTLLTQHAKANNNIGLCI